MEDAPFSDISATQLSQNRGSDCDTHAGPSIQADHQEIIPNIETNDHDAYAEARAMILKELTRPSNSHDIDMLERAFQALRTAREKTDTLPLANSNVALIHHLSVGNNHEVSQVLAPDTQESPIGPGLPKIPTSLDLPKIPTSPGLPKTSTSPGLPKIPTHSYEWRKELYRTHPRKKSTAKLIRAIMRHYTFEVFGADGSPEDILALTKILGLQDVEWRFGNNCAQEIRERIIYALKRYLTTLG